MFFLYIFLLASTVGCALVPLDYFEKDLAERYFSTSGIEAREKCIHLKDQTLNCYSFDVTVKCLGEILVKDEFTFSVGRVELSFVLARQIILKKYNLTSTPCQDANIQLVNHSNGWSIAWCILLFILGSSFFAHYVYTIRELRRNLIPFTRLREGKFLFN